MTQSLVTAAREESLEGVGGLKIFVRSWRPTGQARAVVVICPGFNSHRGYYAWVAEQFTASGPDRARSKRRRVMDARGSVLPRLETPQTE